MINKIGIVILWFVAFASCKQPEESLVPINYHYVVVDSGACWIFQYDSLAFNDNSNTIDTFNLFLKEQISGVIQVNQDRYQVLDRYIGKDTLTMTQRESAYLLLRSNSYERIDQNQRRIKLIFPIKEGQVWNGNAWNDLGRQNFSIRIIPDLILKNQLSFSQVAEVTEANTINIIETSQSKSWYTQGIGLIKHEETKLETQSGKTGGYKVNQELLSFRP